VVPVTRHHQDQVVRVADELPVALAVPSALFPLPASAASSYVCPVDDAAEPFVVGVVVAPDDVAADHAGLLAVAGVVGAVEGEVAQRGELRLYAV
jgi:hypothetical protein